MATKYKTNKRKISSLVKQQVPQYVLEDHPKFTEFLSSYFLFMESAELNLDTITDIDQILLETAGATDSYVLLDQTNKNGLDAGNKLVDEQNTFGGSFQKNETITGSTSGATSTVLAEDTLANDRLFISANNAWITGETDYWRFYIWCNCKSWQVSCKPCRESSTTSKLLLTPTTQ